MSFEGFDEWDEKFLDQAIRLEEEVISTRNPTQTTPVVPIQPHYPPQVHDSTWEDLSFSPPRELSQRFLGKTDSDSFPDADCVVVELPQRPIVFSRTGAIRGGGAEEKEIEQLKRELGRVSKQLNHLEHECVELKRDRDKKGEQLKYTISQLEEKDAEIHSLKGKNMDCEASMQDHRQMPSQLGNTTASMDQFGMRHPICRESTSKQLSHNTKKTLEHDSVLNDGSSAASELKRRVLNDGASKTSNGYAIRETIFHETYQPKCMKAIGTQTDLSNDCDNFAIQGELNAQNDLSNKLLSIWNATSSKRLGGNRVSKLLASCVSDFFVLFRCMSISSELNHDSRAEKSFSDRNLHNHMQSVQTIEATKISRLHAMITKVNNGMMQLDNLLEPLLDLCMLENVVVVHRTLCILHAIVHHMLCFNVRSEGRDNFLVTHSQNPGIPEEKEGEDTGVLFSESWDETSFAALFSSSTRSFDVENPMRSINGGSCGGTFFSAVRWMSLFETVQQIVERVKEEHVRVEAISIMILILMRTDPNSERVKYGSIALFEIVSRLLQKEVGINVQKQAVCLLFLLLNCPKLLMMLCTDHKDHVEDVVPTEMPKDASTLRRIFRSVLEGLAECLLCKGNGSQELKLRRHGIVVVAFIASSGKSGFEPLLDSVLPNGICFLELIVQVLASEMDAEAAELAELHDLCRERTLLMREALILLNRLASNPAYSVAVLGVLTSNRATASMTIDVVDRISKKGKGCQHSDGMKRTHMDTEIADLSRLFWTRVVSFLNGSSRGHGKGQGK